MKRGIQYILFPFACLYRLVTGVRNFCFDHQLLLKSKKFEFPVICIGNLSVGGTGKTPHTEALIRLLSERFRLAVLSRGYKRKSKGYCLANAQTTADELGDEPFQMHLKFPHVAVAVAEKRVVGIEALRQDVAPDMILLDDAFQHRYVKPSLSILLTDFKQLYCDDFLLPMGRLREARKGARRAKIVIVTKCDKELSDTESLVVRERLNLLPQQHLFFTSINYGEPQALFPENKNPLSLSMLQARVILVTGIANPMPLVRELQRYTKEIQQVVFPDHHAFSKKDLDLIDKEVRKEASPYYILTTEKDAIRLRMHALPQHWSESTYFIPIKIEFLFNEENTFNQIIMNHGNKSKTNR